MRQPSLKLVLQWVFCFFAVTLFQRSIGFWGGMREALRKVRSPLPLQRSDLGRERYRRYRGAIGGLPFSNRGFKSFGVGIGMYGRDRRCQAAESVHSQHTWLDADPHGKLCHGSGDVEKHLG